MNGGWLLPGAALIGALTASASAGEDAMSVTAPAFARAAGVPAAAVGTPLAIDLPGGGALASAWVALVDGPAGQQAMLVPLGPDGPGAPLEIGPASALVFAVALDLGHAGRINLRDDATRPRPTPPLARPALLLRTRTVAGAGEQRDELTLVAAETPPRILWQEQITNRAANGAGFDSYELTIGKPARGWPRLTLLQNALPAEGAPASMPGPPLLLEYRWQGGGYQRVD